MTMASDDTDSAFDMVFADDSEVQSGIGEESIASDNKGFDGDDYVDASAVEDETVETEEETDESADEADEEEGEEEEGAEASSEESEDEELEDEPEATGDKVTDGKNKAIWAAREKARKEKEARIEAEKQLAYLKGQQEGMPKPQPVAPKPPDIGPPPEFDYSEVEKSIEAQVQYRLKVEKSQRDFARQQETQQQRNAVLNASIAEARADHEDYDTVEAAWLMRANTADGAHLTKLLAQQSDPAAWMYKNQKSFETRQSRESPEVKALKEELATLKAQTKKAGKKGKKKPAAKRQLNRARGAGPKSQGSTGPIDQNAEFDTLFIKAK